jgi:DNA alkylation damage repair protein AlkB
MMPNERAPLTGDLFETAAHAGPVQQRIADGAMLLHGFATPFEGDLIAAIGAILAQAPFRQMFTPGGHQMSVAMTNCGRVGWVTDRTGYRYDGSDPESGKPWPGMPASFRQLAEQAADRAGFEAFLPDACLINRYQPGARMSLHQDKDEKDFGAARLSWRRTDGGRGARLARSAAHQPDVPQGALTESQLLKTIEERLLGGKNLFAREGNREPLRAVNLGNFDNTAGSGRPLDGNLVAPQAVHVERAFQRICKNGLAAALTHLSQWPHGPGRPHSEFLSELPAGGLLRIFAGLKFPLWDGPGP